MNFEDKFTKLQERVKSVTEVLRGLRSENDELHRENEALKRELGSLRGECHKLKLQAADRTELVTSKLSGVLQRLDELERSEGQ